MRVLCVFDCGFLYILIENSFLLGCRVSRPERGGKSPREGAKAPERELSGRRHPDPEEENNARTAADNGRADSPDEPSPTNGRKRRGRNATPTAGQTERTAGTPDRTTARRTTRRTRKADEEQRTNSKPSHPQRQEQQKQEHSQPSRASRDKRPQARTKTNKQQRKHPQKEISRYWQLLHRGLF